MAPPKTLSKYLTARVTSGDHAAFHRKAQKYGKPSDILRELVQAFNQDRLTIKPPVTVKGNLYHVD